MTMTTREWKSSSDVFAMEYADILERHKILYGESPFEGIAVDRNDLRLQLEHEAMGKLLKLRQGVLATGGDPRRQVELLAGSLSTIMVIFRAVIRLEGAVPAKDNATVSEAVGKYAGFDPAAFQRVIRHVRGEQKIAANEVGSIVAAYLAGMEKLVEHLDRYGS
jgi:hypothetical protein